jgi:hypothetical protein
VRGGFWAPVSGRHFSISLSAGRRPVRLQRDRFAGAGWVAGSAHRASPWSSDQNQATTGCRRTRSGWEPFSCRLWSRRRNLKQTPNQRQPSRSRNASYVGQRVYRSCGLRAGVRLTPQGSPANRSLSAIEPVSAPPKGKLKNGDQRPAPKTRPARTEIRKITDQRLGSARVTPGNVGDSPQRGNKTPETGLPG